MSIIKKETLAVIEITCIVCFSVSKHDLIFCRNRKVAQVMVSCTTKVLKKPFDYNIVDFLEVVAY